MESPSATTSTSNDSMTLEEARAKFMEWVQETKHMIIEWERRERSDNNRESYVPRLEEFSFPLSPQKTEEAYSILKRFPELSKEQVFHPIRGAELSPLCFFLEHPHGGPFVAKVFELTQHCAPINDSAMLFLSASSKEKLMLLASLVPDALDANRVGWVLGRRDLTSDDKLEVLKYFFSLRPESISRVSKKSVTPMALEAAIRYGCSPEIVSFLSENMEPCCEIEIGQHPQNQWWCHALIMDENMASALQKTIVNTTHGISFGVDPNTYQDRRLTWTPAGFRMVASFLQSSKIRALRMNLPSFLSSDEAAQKGFTKLVSSGQLQKLGFRNYTATRAPEPALVGDVLLRLLETMQFASQPANEIMPLSFGNHSATTTSLSLEGFQYSDCLAFSSFLANPNMPEHLILEYTMLEMDQWQPVIDEDATPTCLQVVELRLAAMPHRDVLVGLLGQLCSAPALTKVALQVQIYPTNMQSPVCNLSNELLQLLRARNLCQLTLCDFFPIDLDLFKAILMDNQLTRCDVVCATLSDADLEELANLFDSHNTTLLELNFDVREPGSPIPIRFQEIDHFSRFQYLAMLNSFGRGRLRDIDGTRQHLLASLGEVEARIKCNIRRVSNDKLSLLYGLLRERPSLWSVETLPDK